MLPAIFLLACHLASEKATPAKHVIDIKEMRFQPAELVVHAGDTVEWINHDIVDHDITEEKTKEWHSDVLKKGQSWKTAINKTTDYYCSIHVVMKGKIIIK
jgi:plastocyanin